MRKISFTLILSLLFLQVSIFAQSESVDSTGLPGDNFSLQGALEMFKASASPEDFEERINKEDNFVNNLDLNEDGEIDYIRVEDKMEGNVHAIILQVPINENESQDIAVIEIEKTGEETAILQIVGDEDLYGADTFVEPFEEESKMDGKGGPSADIEIYRIVVNVWGWPSVRFVYGPRYSVWVSPYHWRVYPRGWSPWRPHPWRMHYSNRSHYHRHHHVVHTHRVVTAHKVYHPHRRTSVTVKKRTTTVGVKKSKNGKVVKTKTTTTKGAVKNKNGRVKAGKKTTTTKAGVKKTKNGNVKAGKKTTTTKTRTGKKGGVKKTKTTKSKTRRN